MKTIECIIRTYVAHIHHFNLDDSIECEGLVRNCRSDLALALGFEKLHKEYYLVTLLKEAVSSTNTEEVINQLVEINQLLKSC